MATTKKSTQQTRSHLLALPHSQTEEEKKNEQAKNKWKKIIGMVICGRMLFALKIANSFFFFFFYFVNFELVCLCVWALLHCIAKLLCIEHDLCQWINKKKNGRKKNQQIETRFPETETIASVSCSMLFWFVFDLALFVFQSFSTTLMLLLTSSHGPSTKRFHFEIRFATSTFFLRHS